MCWGMEYDCGALPLTPPKGFALWNPDDFWLLAGVRRRETTASASSQKQQCLY
ncbi:MAG: hypothetical protein RBU37_12900 [Myxococcota bacterium]|nr:hypothetical protein [Myxococcota bacterium]